MSSALETLRRDFGGDIIEPGGAEYESASRSVLASGPVEIHVVFDGDDPDLAAQAIDPIRRLAMVTATISR